MSSNDCLPIKGEVCTHSIETWHQVYPQLLVRTQHIFSRLNDIYTSPPVMYDQNGDFGEFNLRYYHHPLTNLTEAIAVDYLISLHGDIPIDIITDKNDQISGADIEYYSHDRRVLVSVKMCSVWPDTNARHFIISGAIRSSVINDTGSDITMFVDVYNNAVVSASTPALKQALTGHTDRKIRNSNQYRVFYDELGMPQAIGYDRGFGC